MISDPSVLSSLALSSPPLCTFIDGLRGAGACGQGPVPVEDYIDTCPAGDKSLVPTSLVIS